MDIGVFDHLDQRDVPLAEFYESRLRLLETYDAAGFYSYHLAEHHATPLGLRPRRASSSRPPPSAPGASGSVPACTACRSTTRSG